MQKALTGRKEEEIWVNYSPGTPQMQTAWFLLVNSSFLKAKLFRAEGEEIEIEPLFEDQFLNEACNLLKICNFDAAAELFESLSKKAIIKERISIFHIFATICSALKSWNSFDYQASVKEIEKALKKFDGLQKTGKLKKLSDDKQYDFNEFRKNLLQIRDLFGELQTNFSIHLSDIYENALRHYHYKHYHEVVWKLDVLMDFAVIEKAIREIEAQFNERYLAKSFYTEVENGNNTRLKQLVNNMKQPRVIYKDLREKEAKTILIKISSPSVKSILSGFDRKPLADTRNKAMHYAKPISSSETYRSLENSRHFVEQLLDEKILTNYDHPLSLDQIEDLAKTFRNIGTGIS
ncbi:MAG: hypothetical protein AAB336_11575 [Acidobacteriota bacterium]